MPFDRVRVLGFPVDVVSERDVLQFVRTRVEEKQPAQIVTLNAEFTIRARKDPEFARVLREADLVTPDSAGVVWAARRKGAPLDRRVGGSDLIWSICGQAADTSHRVFLLGGANGVAEEAGRHLVSRYRELAVAGTYAGSPSVEDEDAIVDLIRRSHSDILFVAYGAPEQELWIARNLERTGARVALGVGGTFDYLAGRARRAPVWLRDHGLEWSWRLLHQPWRWRRMLALPQFVWLVHREDRIRAGAERTTS